MHTADLIALNRVSAMPEEIQPFVQFKAELKKRELRKDLIVALLLVQSTSCYIPVFLDDYDDIGEIKRELGEQDAELSPSAERAIWEYLERRSTVKNK
ncbi:MAG TPA: DUF749 domain-containing protein [Euryarchaeota archaeon]|nr:DUF749 domain-containing protein [Euryarchaeota archaeon]